MIQIFFLYLVPLPLPSVPLFLIHLLPPFPVSSSLPSPPLRPSPPHLFLLPPRAPSSPPVPRGAWIPSLPLLRCCAGCGRDGARCCAAWRRWGAVAGRVQCCAEWWRGAVRRCTVRRGSAQRRRRRCGRGCGRGAARRSGGKEQRGGGGEQKPAAHSAPWSRAAPAGRARHSAHADALPRPPHQRTPPRHRPLPRRGRHSAPPPSVKGIMQRHCVLSLFPHSLHTPVIFLGFLGIFRSWHLATIWLAFLKGLQC